jgi:hypothetical protein
MDVDETWYYILSWNSNRSHRFLWIDVFRYVNDLAIGNRDVELIV